MTRPIFQGVDCVMLRVGDLEAAIGFYGGRLGHALVWRSDAAAGLRLPGSATELVLHTEHGPETDLLVGDVGEAFERFLAAGGTAIEPPFEIAIGRCAVVADPFGNRITMLDQSKGALVTDAGGRVIGPRPAP